MNSTQPRPRAGEAEAGGARKIATANAPADSPAVAHSQVPAAAPPRARALPGTAAASSSPGVATSAATAAATRAGERHEERRDGDNHTGRDDGSNHQVNVAPPRVPALRSWRCNPLGRRDVRQLGCPLGDVA